MTRLAYAALAFVAAKLLFEDLRQGHMEFIAASIFLFAVTLMAVPRLVRMGAKSYAESHARLRYSSEDERDGCGPRSSRVSGAALQDDRNV